MDTALRDAQQTILDEKVSRLDVEVKGEIARLLAEVDEKVSRLRQDWGEEKSRLNRQRNNMSPVYRLPPELVSRIFFASLVTSQASKKAALLNPYARIHPEEKSRARHPGYGFELWQEMPDILRLCHVCQYWRTVALGFPALWSHIQVEPWMHPEFLEYIRSNTKMMPITLDIRDSVGVPFASRGALPELIKAEVGRLESLAIHCNQWFVQVDPGPPLFQQLTASANRLESIQIILFGAPLGRQIATFPSALPSLTCLELRGITVPWSSSILRSPKLAYLVLHDTPKLCETTMDELLSFLGQATELVSLYINLPRQKHLTWRDVGGEPASPINISIDTLQLVSTYFAPLSLLMDAIRIDDMMALNLKVLCAEEGPHLQAICEFTHPRMAPEQIEIGFEKNVAGEENFVVSCDFRYFVFENNFRDCVWAPNEQPWISVGTGKRFPFPELSLPRYRVPWCFSNLCVFAIDDVPVRLVPQGFWEELSGLPTLEVVHLKVARITLLAKFLRSMSRVDMRPNPPQYPISSTKVPASHPFPRLRAIVLDSLGKVAGQCARDLRQAGYGVSHEGMAMPPGLFYLTFISAQLRPWRDYGRRQLIQLSLQAEEGTLEEGDSDQQTREMFEGITPDILKWLKSIARTVVLGHNVIWDYYADRDARTSKPLTAGEPTPSDQCGCSKE